MEDRNLSLSAVAGSLGVSERTVRRWIKSGKLKAYKPGRDYRIPESALRALVEESEVSPKAQSPLPLEYQQPRVVNGISANSVAPITVEIGGNIVYLKHMDVYRGTADRLRRFVRAAEEGREEGLEYREVMEALDEFSTAYGVVGRGDPEHPALREMDAIAHELHGVMVELRAEYERRGRATGERLEALAKTA